MKAVYHPKGKAGEYADWALNLFSGCSNLCQYCYVPSVMHKTREEFHTNVQPRKDILLNLEEDVKYLCTYPELPPCRSIFLCFACDPYPTDDPYELTRRAIRIIHGASIKVMILTKGGRRAERDFDLLTDKDQFGVTLTCLDEAESLKWEPGAALPVERMISLKQAKYHSIQTWVSLEPVLNPETTLEIIRQTNSYVDMYKVGVLNYHPLTQTIDCPKF
ncbi:MAG: radical SAM protein, partial [Dehalococcoidales bacterium]|nr:radical SAM protein [Dehalococcoidales bacterium]